MRGKTSAALRVALAPLDVSATFGVHAMGKFDPTAVRDTGYFKKAFSTASGVSVVEVVSVGKGAVDVRVGGADGDAVQSAMELSLAHDDGHATFAPEHPLISKLHRTLRGMRIVPIPWAFDVACQTILGQRVTTEDAMRGFRRITERYGARADDLRAFPSAPRVAEMPTWQLEELGVDPKRARAMIGLARAIVARPGFWSSPLLVRILESIRGIGPWTIGNVMGFAMGDPDALVLGDLHLPHVVSWALAQEPRGSDERMLELLQPFAGQRFRVTRLLMSAGLKAPRTR